MNNAWTTFKVTKCKFLNCNATAVQGTMDHVIGSIWINNNFEYTNIVYYILLEGLTVAFSEIFNGWGWGICVVIGAQKNGQCED